MMKKIIMKNYLLKTIIIILLNLLSFNIIVYSQCFKACRNLISSCGNIYLSVNNHNYSYNNHIITGELNVNIYSLYFIEAKGLLFWHSCCHCSDAVSKTTLSLHLCTDTKINDENNVKLDEIDEYQMYNYHNYEGDIQDVSKELKMYYRAFENITLNYEIACNLKTNHYKYLIIKAVTDECSNVCAEMSYTGIGYDDIIAPYNIIFNDGVLNIDEIAAPKVIAYSRDKIILKPGFHFDATNQNYFFNAFIACADETKTNNTLKSWGNKNNEDTNNYNIDDCNDSINKCIMFPNPTINGQSSLIFNNIKNYPINIKIINTYGQIVLNDKIYSSQYLIDLTDQAKGIYFVKILLNNEIFFDKLIYK